MDIGGFSKDERPVTFWPIEGRLLSRCCSESCSIIRARKVEFPTVLLGLFKHVYEYYWGIDDSHVVDVVDNCLLNGADIL